MVSNSRRYCDRSDLGIPPDSALHSLCGAIASSDFMLSNLLDNSYSAANVNKFKLDRPKTAGYAAKPTLSLPKPARQTLALKSLGFWEGDACFLLSQP
ncbi:MULTISPECIES: hypothetical protein [unclassified Microcoleus]|uniref:hypothetical protein n=1 Tax=unclassified Microcoleus TaxID=2642155 RepID=UPI0025DDA63B|nr:MULTISPECIES: hypothetical protein [unclassified Microcoleus]